MVSTACPAPSIMTTDMDILSLTSKSGNSHQPIWDGEGRPPVGCECEIKRIADWMPATIKFISDHHTVFTTFGGTEDCYQTCSLQFRPIRSKEDRKRDAACDAMHKRWREVAGQTREDGSLVDIYSCIYDAIVAGNIPGVYVE